MPDITVGVIRVDGFSAAAASALKQAYDDATREVWVTSSLRIDGVDNTVRRKLEKNAEVQLTANVTGASGGSLAAITFVPPLPMAATVTNTQTCEFRLSITLANPEGTVGTRVSQPLPAPFYTNPTCQISCPDYTVTWSVENHDQPELLEESYCDIDNHLTAASRNCTTALAPPLDCRNYRPQRRDSAVIAGAEYSTPGLSVANWSTAGVYHDPAYPDQAGATRCRSRNDVTAIVLHETAGWETMPCPIPGNMVLTPKSARTLKCVRTAPFITIMTPSSSPVMPRRAAPSP